MRIEQAFLADILEHPDDDAVRLVFADWLQDNGDPDRAEFIRVQCECEGLPDGHPRLEVLLRRGDELLRKNQQRWQEGVAECGGSWPIFRRGFIEAVDCSARALLACGDRLFAQAPLGELTLYDAGGRLERLARCGFLARLTTLRLTASSEPLCQPQRVRPFMTLLGSAHLRNLRVLDLTGCSLGAAGVSCLACVSNPEHLAELGLGGNGLGDDAVAALVGSRYRGALEVLDLRGNAVTDEGARLLARPASLPRLRWLRLEHNPITDVGVEALLDSPGLTHLSCDANRLSPAARERLRERFGSPEAG
jgi:uncharacterized protein (TIGR02996 family)